MNCVRLSGCQQIGQLTEYACSMATRQRMCSGLIDVSNGNNLCA